MRWCINGELMVLVAVVPKHAQCPAVLLSELPPKSFHGWTVRTLLHKKATSVPGSQVLLIGSEALIQYQSPSTIQINCVKIRTVTFMWTLEGQVGVEGVTYQVPIKYCIATFLYTLTIIFYLVVYTCSYTESRVESRVRSPYYLSFVIPEVPTLIIVGRRSAISLYLLLLCYLLQFSCLFLLSSSSPAPYPPCSTALLALLQRYPPPHCQLDIFSSTDWVT